MTRPKMPIQPKSQTFRIELQMVKIIFISFSFYKENTIRNIEKSIKSQAVVIYI